MPNLADACASEDTELEKWTFLRYCVLGLVFLSQVLKLRWGAQAEEKAREQREAEEKPDQEEVTVTEEPAAPGGNWFGGAVAEEMPGQEGTASGEPLLSKRSYKYQEHPYKEHPDLTAKITSTGFFESILRAGWMFVLTEGVGLTIYFSMSAVMDNIAIFFIKGAGVCATVKAVSLYTMAVVTFLPNVLLGSRLQRTLYNNEEDGRGPFGNKLYNKALFVVIMALMTVASFLLRMWLVYAKGYVSKVNWLLNNVSSQWRVVLAVAVPPMIDGIQSTALIMTGSHAKPLLAVITDRQKALKEQITSLEERLLKVETQLNILTAPPPPRWYNGTMFDPKWWQW
jgi:hypothetical protein